MPLWFAPRAFKFRISRYRTTCPSRGMPLITLISSVTDPARMEKTAADRGPFHESACYGHNNNENGRAEIAKTLVFDYLRRMPVCPYQTRVSSVQVPPTADRTPHA